MDKFALDHDSNGESLIEEMVAGETVLNSLLGQINHAQDQLIAIKRHLNGDQEASGTHLANPAFNEINHLITHSHDVNSIINLVDKLLCDSVQYDACSVVLVNDERSGTFSVKSSMLNDALIEQLQQSILDAVWSLCGHRIELTSLNMNMRTTQCSGEDVRFQSFCNVPMHIGPKLWAMLQIASFIPGNFDAEQVKEVTAIADQVSAMHDNLEGLVCCERNKLAAIINNMTDGVVAINKEGQVELINRVAGVLLNTGDNPAPQSVRAAIENIGLRNIFTGIAGTNEFVGKSPLNKILQFKWASIRSESGKEDGAKVVIIRDITNQTQLERAQSEFIAAISHELRTPLTTIQNSLSNMLAGVTGSLNPKMQNYLQTMENDCHRLAHLINDLLDISKLETGKMPLNKSMVSLSEVAEKAVNAMRTKATQKHIKINCVSEFTGFPVYIDASRILQVFGNLLSNAVKYTAENGSITVKVFETFEEIVAVVEDSGIGIPHELLGKVFNKFYQISRQAGPGYNGSGLGLTLCNEIIAIHGGRMWVESQPNKGSKFYFSLPKTRSEIALCRHITALKDKSCKNESQFAILAITLKLGLQSRLREHHPALKRVLQDVVSFMQSCCKSGDDMVIVTAENEIVMVLSDTGKRFIQHIKRNLSEIINVTLQNSHCNDGLIVPMIGMSLFPGDGSDMQQLISKARRELNELK